MRKTILIILAVTVFTKFIYFLLTNPIVNVNYEESLEKSDFRILICSEDVDEEILFDQLAKINFNEYRYGVHLRVIYKDSLYNDVSFWIDPDDIDKKYKLNFHFGSENNNVNCFFFTEGLKRDATHEQKIILDKKINRVVK